MRNDLKQSTILAQVLQVGGDILSAPNMQREKLYTHHATVNCYQHSLSVACMSLRLAEAIGTNVNRRSLIRGALLHDYFLYDWRDTAPEHKLHGFRHARRALINASRDFQLDDIQSDIIARHMFPLNLRPPRYRESMIVCLADKLCAARELSAIRPRHLACLRRQ